MEEQVVILIQILVSLLFSAFFSGMEIVFVSSNQLLYEIDHKQMRLTYKVIGIFYRNQEQFISTILVGNNIALVIYSIKMSELLMPYLNIDNEALSAFTQTCISTIIILITGEYLPKALFGISPNFFLKAFAWPLFLIYIVLYPIAKFSTFLSKCILKMIGMRNVKFSERAKLGIVDLDYLLQTTGESPNEEVENEVKILQKALDFSSVKLRNCMVPRKEIAAVHKLASLEELRQKFIDTGFSKIVVYDEDIDDIVGYVHTIDMFKSPKQWQRCIKEMPLVPETMSANKLMDILMQSKISLATVVDEFGGTAGIVSLEDMVEEIFGEIEDEHDNEEYVMSKISDSEYVLSGRLEIEKINEEFELNLPESVEYQTLAGLILHYCEKIPLPNEIIKLNGDFTFKIIKSSASKIDLVKLLLTK